MHQDKTAAKNKAFKKLKKAEKRVAIAKDVLKYLKKGKFQAARGEYVNTDPQEGNLGTCELLQNAEMCQVCGLGALFVAGALKDCSIIKDDIFTRLNYDGKSQFMQFYDDEMRGALGKYFSLDQLETIENAFESFTMGKGKGSTFNKGFGDATTRLSRIMKNIIKNEGTFKP